MTIEMMLVHRLCRFVANSELVNNAVGDLQTGAMAMRSVLAC
jgi:hypothetical protein